MARISNSSPSITLGCERLDSNRPIKPAKKHSLQQNAKGTISLSKRNTEKFLVINFCHAARFIFTIVDSKNYKSASHIFKWATGIVI